MHLWYVSSSEGFGTQDSGALCSKKKDNFQSMKNVHFVVDEKREEIAIFPHFQ